MSISDESSTAGDDIAADQEYLCPTFSNLDPSEELRLLHERIAQLELQQTNNLPTSSSNSDLVAQNAKDVEDTLHRQNDEIEPTNDKESTADQQEEEQKKSDLPTDDTVKLADFGISRQQNAEGFAQTGAPLQVAGMRSGTAVHAEDRHFRFNGGFRRPRLS
ncbi:hypothetical protein GPALN_007765 [Globodera pallida]|nr:hypothetical protein GPALN_007765 [Globodera pallida]